MRVCADAGRSDGVAMLKAAYGIARSVTLTEGGESLSLRGTVEANPRATARSSRLVAGPAPCQALRQQAAGMIQSPANDLESPVHRHAIRKLASADRDAVLAGAAGWVRACASVEWTLTHSIY